jgi:glutathione S-transferase
MLELYHFHGATCGLKARIALAEKGVDYVEQTLTRADVRSSQYFEVNPNAVVPTLIHNGNRIFESSCIINYIDDAFEGPELKPANPLSVAYVWWWLKRADECLPMIGTLTYTVSMRPKLIAMEPKEIEQHVQGIPNLATRARRRRIIEQGYEAADFGQSIKGLLTMLADMENTLMSTEWLIGDVYTLSDIAMTPIIERIHELEFHGLLDKYPAVSVWYERVRARKSYEECLGATPNPEGPQHSENGKKAWPIVMEMQNL